VSTDQLGAAKDLLPPETLQHYKRPVPPHRRFTGNAGWEPSFKDATEQNAAQLDVDDVGTIIYKASKQPSITTAFPFPSLMATPRQE
jgi:hypothetical protein